MSCSPYFNLNTTTEEMENKILSMGDLFDRQNDSAKNYDSMFLNQSISVLNGLIDIVKSNSDLYNYPMLVDRLNTGPISPTEYADFLIATGTTQETVEVINNTYLNYSSNTVGFVDGSYSSNTINGINIVGTVPSAVSRTANSTVSEYSAPEYFGYADPEPVLKDGIVAADTGIIWEYTGSTAPGNINGFIDSGISIYPAGNVDTTNNYLSVSALQYLQNMNSYYTDNFASDITGGICGLYNMFTSWLEKFKANLNLLLGLLSIDKLIKQLIETIKNQILSMINQLIGQINSCLGSIAGIAESVKNIANFFSDANINSLKDTVSIAIADIASKFEIPQTQTDPFKIVTQELEATQYLLYRLCQFTTAIEDFLMSPYRALQNAIANCKQVGTVLTNMSNQFTLEALTAGAFRMGDSNIDAVKRMLGAQLNTLPTNTGGAVNNTIPSGTNSTTGAGTSGSATPSSYWTTPFSEDEKAMAVELVSATAEQIRAGGTRAQQYLQFQSQVLNQNDPYDCAGVKELQPSIIIIAVRIAKTLGTKLIINSGYRSPAYNAKQSGSAKNSYHMKGLAMDCSRTAYGSDFTSGERFIKIASQEGIGGIGTYPTFIHIDTGPRRSWTTIAGQPLGHDNARSLHKQDKFRNGL